MPTQLTLVSFNFTCHMQSFGCSFLRRGKQLKKRKVKVKFKSAPKQQASSSKGKSPQNRRRLKRSKRDILKRRLQVSASVLSRKGQQAARRWAGCTGLGDTPLLPPLFTNVEDTYTLTLLLNVYLRLCQRAGVRPVGIQVDDLAANFSGITEALRAFFPAKVSIESVSQVMGLTPQQKDFLDSGGIIIDRNSFTCHNLLLGQDPLHVFFRLTEKVNWKSMDGAFALRCLRKMLRSWNFEEVGAEDHTAFSRSDDKSSVSWMNFTEQGCGSHADIVEAYFRGTEMPLSSFDSLILASQQDGLLCASCVVRCG